MPMSTTKKDFWRLVEEHDIHTIVMMNSLAEVKVLVDHIYCLPFVYFTNHTLVQSKTYMISLLYLKGEKSFEDCHMEDIILNDRL